MHKKYRRQLRDGELLFETLVEFIKCWGSGRRSRLFVESMNGQAFMNFSTFLGNPGTRNFRQNKMASEDETQGYPESPKSTSLGNPEKDHFRQDIMTSGKETQGYPEGPKSSQNSKRKKSKKKTERDNQRAAIFQKRKQEDLLAAAANGNSLPSAAVTSTPNKQFDFSKPICENINGTDSSDNTSVIMNLDGNVTLSHESCQGIKEEKEKKDANDTSSEHEDDSRLSSSESESEPIEDGDMEAISQLETIFSTLVRKRVPAKAIAALKDFKSDILLIAKEIEKISNTEVRFQVQREAYQQLEARRAILIIGNCRSKKEKDDLWKVDFSVIEKI